MSHRSQHFDVVVVGGGSAGVAAALGAARRGAKVALLEKNSFLGGMGTAAYVGTVCGLYHRSLSAPCFLSNPFSQEFAERLMRADNSAPTCYAEGLWFVPYEMQSFMDISASLLSSASVSVLYGTSVTSAHTSGGMLQEIACHSQGSHLRFFAKAFIDASGSGALAKLCGAPFLEGTARQAGALSFEISGITPHDALLVPQMVAKELMRGVMEKAIPEEVSRVSMVPGTLRLSEKSDGPVTSFRALFKLALPEVMDLQGEDAEGLHPIAQKRAAAALAYLSSRCIDFQNATLSSIASQVGIRTGPRAQGEAILSESAVRSAQKPDSSIAWGAWPIEMWGSGRGPQLSYLPEGECYGIPAECLKVLSIKNLWTAGRGISADDGAIASARVMGTCLATGYAAGEMAARSL